MMERQEIEALFAKIDTQEASTLPDRWWDRSTFNERSIVDLACLLVVPSANEEAIHRDVFRGLCGLPPGCRVRVVNPSREALVAYFEKASFALRTRGSDDSVKVCDDGASVEWTTRNGVTRLALPMMFLIYKAEMGSPGFW